MPGQLVFGKDGLGVAIGVRVCVRADGPAGADSPQLSMLLPVGCVRACGGFDEEARIAALPVRVGSFVSALGFPRKREEAVERRITGVELILVEIVRDVDESRFEAAPHAVDDRASSVAVAALESDQIDIEDPHRESP